jgi:hypothetical protein
MLITPISTPPPCGDRPPQIGQELRHRQKVIALKKGGDAEEEKELFLVSS